MSKAEFWILNLIGGLCALLITGTIIFGKIDARLNNTVSQTQNRYQPQFNEVQQQFLPYQNLAVRVAHTAQTNALLLNLMRRHGVSVDLKLPDGKTKPVPPVP